MLSQLIVSVDFCVLALKSHNRYMKVYPRICGQFFGRKPALIIFDPKLVRLATIKLFPNFVKRMGVSFC
jgi:hypothetical protein